MGQEIVYCFKCQQRIVSADYAKGLAYQLENNSCCSTCAVEVLETLPAKQKEQLLAKMFKATQQKSGGQSKTSGALKAIKPTGSGSMRKIPVQAPPKSPAALIGGLTAGAVVLVLLIVAMTMKSSPPPPAPPPAPTPVVEKRPEVRPGPGAEEQRRTAAAKEAMQKARDFVSASPKELHGHVRVWKAALIEALGTGYEAEAKREADKAEARVREEAGELERRVAELCAKKDYKGARDFAASTKSKDALDRQIRDSAERAFMELKDKALADRARGAKDAVEAAKGELARWGFPDLVEQLNAALSGAWIPIFDGKSTGFMSGGSAPFWKVEDGALVRIVNQGDNQQAGQSREQFTDGEFRCRARIGGTLSLWSFSVRQGDGTCRVILYRDAIVALGEGEHEILITCRGTQITGTVDGKPAKIDVQKQALPKGHLQFNGKDGDFRVLAIDWRPLP